jgi:hypothetical protein
VNTLTSNLSKQYNPVDEEDEFNKESGLISERTSVAEFEMLEKQCI